MEYDILDNFHLRSKIAEEKKCSHLFFNILPLCLLEYGILDNFHLRHMVTEAKYIRAYF